MSQQLVQVYLASAPSWSWFGLLSMTLLLQSRSLHGNQKLFLVSVGASFDLSVSYACIKNLHFNPPCRLSICAYIPTQLSEHRAWMMMFHLKLPCSLTFAHTVQNPGFRRSYSHEMMKMFYSLQQLMVLSSHLLTTPSTATLTQGCRPKRPCQKLSVFKYILNTDRKQVAFIKV